MPKLTPPEVDFADVARIKITSNVTENGTPDEVWAVLIDNERWPEWFAAAKACRVETRLTRSGLDFGTYLTRRSAMA
jgi:uncharacterized protein YndB with AHSA1/START domain